MVFVLKGGKYSLRYLYRKELSEKYEIYRRTILYSPTGEYIKTEIFKMAASCFVEVY